MYFFHVSLVVQTQAICLQKASPTLNEPSPQTQLLYFPVPFKTLVLKGIPRLPDIYTQDSADPSQSGRDEGAPSFGCGLSGVASGWIWFSSCALYNSKWTETEQSRE